MKFIPSLELLEAASIKIKEGAEHTLSPFESKIHKDEKVSQLSASAIANVCGCSRTDVLHILKDVFLRIVENVKEGTGVVLDVKVG